MTQNPTLETAETAEQVWFQERGHFEYFLIGQCPVFAVLVNTPAYILSIILLERRTPSDLTKTAFEKAFNGIYCERTIPKLHMCYFQYHHQLSILVKAMPGLVKGLQGVGWVIRESRPPRTPPPIFTFIFIMTIIIKNVHNCML